ncbi:MAG: LacI family DNA-binding transcriptional regulator [Spirochaetaceae bacterium]|nr:LacI family DNA-binding transcriptional regulator [Spirochaetaceae bacterium]
MTVYEIARLAGTSKSTVSRILNGNDRVCTEVREKVLSIIKDTHFSPNAAARGLSRGRKSTISVISPGLGEGFFLRLLQGINHGLKQVHVHMLSTFAHDDQDYWKLWQQVSQGDYSDGLIMVCPPDELYQNPVENQDFPMVICSSEPMGDHTWRGISSVCFNNKEGMSKLLNYLYSQGCRNPLYIPSARNIYDARERLEVFNRFVLQMKIKHQIMKRNIYNPDHLEDQLLDFLNEMDFIPDVIICFNDYWAVRSKNILKDTPFEKIPMAGFDGEAMAALLNIPTVKIPSFQQGRLAAELIYKLVEGTEKKVQHIKQSLSLEKNN